MATINSTHLSLQGARIHYLEAVPKEVSAVVFFHGTRFSARTWRELGTLELLAEKGDRAIAFNWPG